ncbi:MAG: type II secretion system F family protein [bacterium]
MPLYRYHALDAKGKRQTGVVSAMNAAFAQEQIKRLGFFPTRVIEEKPSAMRRSFFSCRRVRGETLATFTRQLAILVRAGVPLLKGLRLLERQEKCGMLREVIQELTRAIEEGASFSESLTRHPKVFNKLYIGMIRAGEESGALGAVLDRLAQFMEKSRRVRRKMTSALMYPSAVLLLALGILVLLLAFVIPKFQTIFAQLPAGHSLPFFTRLMIQLCSWVHGHFFLIAAGILVFVAVCQAAARTDRGIFWMDRLKLRIPVVGDLLNKAAVARLARTLGVLLAQGMPILQALSIVKGTAGNEVFARAIGRVYDGVKEGESVTAALQADELFPPMLIGMVQVGEETGHFSDALVKAAEAYEEEVDAATAAFLALLEPAAIIALAVIVGAIVVALFLPMISLITDLTSAS